MRRWINAFLIIGAIVIIFVALTGEELGKINTRNKTATTGLTADEIEDRLREEDDDDTAVESNDIVSDKETDDTSNEASVSTIDIGRLNEDEEVFDDEEIALMGVDSESLDLVTYIGKTYEEIENDLFVVFLEEGKFYGNIARYGSNRFYLDDELICYGVEVENESLLGITYPIEKLKLQEIVGKPVSVDEDGVYYAYKNHLIYGRLKGTYIEKTFVTGDFAGALNYTVNDFEHRDSMLVSSLNVSEDDIRLTEGYAFGVEIGCSEAFLHDVYMSYVKQDVMDENVVKYTYVNTVTYEVIAQNDKVIAVNLIAE